MFPWASGGRSKLDRMASRSNDGIYGEDKSASGEASRRTTPSGVCGGAGCAGDDDNEMWERRWKLL